MEAEVIFRTFRSGNGMAERISSCIRVRKMQHSRVVYPFFPTFRCTFASHSLSLMASDKNEKLWVAFGAPRPFDPENRYVTSYFLTVCPSHLSSPQPSQVTPNTASNHLPLSRHHRCLHHHHPDHLYSPRRRSSLFLFHLSIPLRIMGLLHRQRTPYV